MLRYWIYLQLNYSKWICTKLAGLVARDHRYFHSKQTSHRLCPSTAGCSPPSMPSIVVCLGLSCSTWFPPLLCCLATFWLVVLLIFSLSLVVSLWNAWSTCCLLFLLYVPSLFIPSRLSGLVVKASTSRVEDPGFESHLRQEFFWVESYQWLKNWHSSGYPARCLAL